jgi:hypothetical protein
MLDLLSAHALYALDGAEAARVPAHLAEGVSCRAQLASPTEAAWRLAEPDRSDPLPHLRGRVLAAIEHARADPVVAAAPPVARSRPWTWPRGAGVLAAIALGTSHV